MVGLDAAPGEAQEVVPTPPVPVAGPNPVDLTGHTSEAGVPIWGYPWPVVIGTVGAQPVAQPALVASVAPAAPAAPIAPAAPDLPNTGPMRSLSYLVLAGGLLVDVGYLALSATRRGRPLRALVAPVLNSL